MSTLTTVAVSIVVYLLIGFITAWVSLGNTEDRKGLQGCASVVFGTVAWPLVCLIVLVVKAFKK